MSKLKKEKEKKKTILYLPSFPISFAFRTFFSRKENWWLLVGKINIKIKRKMNKEIKSQKKNFIWNQYQMCDILLLLSLFIRMNLVMYIVIVWWWHKKKIVICFYNVKQDKNKLKMSNWKYESFFIFCSHSKMTMNMSVLSV